MSKEFKEQIIKRLKSFAWRLGAYCVVSSLAFILDLIGLFDIPAEIVVIIAYVVGEITKFINSYAGQQADNS